MPHHAFDRRRRARAVIVALIALVVLAACSRADTPTSSSPAAPAGGPADEVRLGYFPNVTHAPAIIAVERGLFRAELGDTELVPQTFNAGGDAVNALLGGSLDVTYIGSGPAINAFAKSNGQAVRLIAGATEGGAQLVVKPEITSPAQLVGRTIATPQLGNTQDIALKKWLKGSGLTVGDGPYLATVANVENPRTFDAFRQGSVDGGWLPEPWSSRLVLDAGAKVLVDERSLWSDGKFPTTVMVIRTEFLEQHPETVRALLRGHLAALDFAAASPVEARSLVNASLERLTGNKLSEPVLERAFAAIRLDPNPLAATFPQLAEDSVTAEITGEPTDLTGFVDVTALNAELRSAGKPVVDAAGLDRPRS